MELRLAVVQPETLTDADAPRNVDRAVAYIRPAAREGARLVAVPRDLPRPLHGACEQLFAPTRH